MLGQALGCRAMPPTTGALFRDKSLQKLRLRAAGLPVAPATVIEDIRNVGAVSFEYERAVLKPIAGGGTRVTSIVHSAEELQRVSREYVRRRVPQRTFLLEEFVPGDEWVADGVVFGGEVLFFGLATYGQPCITAIMEQVPLLMRRLDPHSQAWAYAAAEPVVRRAIAALDMEDGVFHMELFYDRASDRIVFSECGARRGGALTQEENHSKFNVDMGDAALMCALGRRPELNVKVRPAEVACVFLPSREGTLVSYPSRAEILAQPNVEFVRMELPFGTKTASGFADSVERVGAVLMAAEGLDQLFRRVDEVRRWFDERMVVAPTEGTVRERWAWQHEHWPLSDSGDVLYGGP
jgi:biotin carboxylase